MRKTRMANCPGGILDHLCYLPHLIGKYLSTRMMVYNMLYCHPYMSSGLHTATCKYWHTCRGYSTVLWYKTAVLSCCICTGGRCSTFWATGAVNLWKLWLYSLRTSIIFLTVNTKAINFALGFALMNVLTCTSELTKMAFCRFFRHQHSRNYFQKLMLLNGSTFV